MDAEELLAHIELVNEIDGWCCLGRSRQYVVDRLLFRYELDNAFSWVFVSGGEGWVEEFRAVVRYIIDDPEFNIKEESTELSGNYLSLDTINEVNTLKGEVEFDTYDERSWSEGVIGLIERYRLFLPFAALKDEFASKMGSIIKENGGWLSD
ncbi:MAG: hypothetical protein ACKOW9_06590 [Candidatus Paceibacterota bacterium]